jgi:hypothetical protein
VTEAITIKPSLRISIPTLWNFIYISIFLSTQKTQPAAIIMSSRLFLSSLLAPHFHHHNPPTPLTISPSSSKIKTGRKRKKKEKLRRS